MPNVWGRLKMLHCCLTVVDYNYFIYIYLYIYICLYIYIHIYREKYVELYLSFLSSWINLYNKVLEKKNHPFSPFK